MANSFEKLPPQAPDIERAVLGAMMLEKSAIGTAVELLSREPESFYKPAHSLVFRAITDLYDENHPVDQLSVTQKLRENGHLENAGGEAAIASLAGEITSVANIRYHCDILLEKAMLRKMITLSTAIQKQCFDDTAKPSDILNTLEENIMNLSDLRGTREFDTLAKKVYEAHDEIVRRAETKGGVTGVKSGFDRLDRITSGWQKSDLIILAGRPSMGKTALALELAKNAAYSGTPVAVFSLEMSSLQLVMRLLFNEGRFDGSSLHSRKPTQGEWTRLSDACQRLSEYPLYIDDTPGLSSIELAAKAKRLKREKNIGMIIVDYLQLMQGSTRESRQQEISAISRGLKLLAKEIDVPVLVLSQLSRAVEQRGGDHRPMLSDLRESGAIEQDADVVMFIYRGSVYGQVEEGEYMINDENIPAENVAEVIIRKQRNGPIGTVLLHWIKENTKFAEFNYTSTEEFF